MNRFVFTLLLSLTFICVSNCVEFCDIKSFDNVFNVGHFVHMTRCGQVWTFDPRMNERSGGFIRDYSWYVKARQLFFGKESKRGTYNDQAFRFAAFSFHEINCVDIPINVLKSCRTTAAKWNNFGVIVDDYEAYAFIYESGFDDRESSIRHSFGSEFPLRQDMDKSLYKFWPNISELTTKANFYIPIERANIHSALFSPHERILYMVLRNEKKTEKQFCLTYLRMEEMLYDIRKFNPPTYDWKLPNCFTGHVIGMFYDENEKKPFLVGSNQHSVAEFEDQLYHLTTEGDGPAALKPFFKQMNRRKRQTNKAQNLREYFGCDPSPTTSNSKRKKRSIVRSEPMSRFSWKAIHKELTEDWIELSVMSFAVLFLLYFIFKLKIPNN